MPALSPNTLIPLLLAVIGLLLLFVYFRNLARVRTSQEWPAVQGIVVQSWVRRSRTTDSDGSASSTYYPEVRYQYQVMGNEYPGEKIAFGPKSGGNRSAAEKVVAKYPTGANVMVYYQPDNPANAVLERSISRGLLIMGAAFVLGGIFITLRWG